MIGNNNRRKFLKGIAAGATLPLASGTVVAQDSDWDGSKVVSLKRPYENPVTAKEIQSKAEKLQKEYVNATGVEEPDPVVVSKPETTEGSPVATALKMASDGTLHQFTGVANRPRDVGKAHRRLAEEIREMKTNDTTTTNEVSTQDNSNWTTRNSSKTENYSDPYGDLVDVYEFMHHDSEPAYMYKETFQMSAGYLVYDSDWLNNYGTSKQEWSQDGAETEIREYRPRTNYSGTVSTTVELSMSIGDAGVAYGYTYSQSEVDMTDKSVDQYNYAEWKMDVATTTDPDGPDHNTVTFDPGSMAKYEGSATGERLLDVGSHAHFTDGYNNHTSDNWFSFDIEGCGIGC